MFKKTITFSELNNGGTSVAAELKDGEVLQIFHRGSEVKVMMTQEHYFTLLARLEKAENAGKRTSYDPEKLMKSFEEKVRKLDDMLKRAPRGKKGTV